MFHVKLLFFLYKEKAKWNILSKFNNDITKCTVERLAQAVCICPAVILCNFHTTVIREILSFVVPAISQEGSVFEEKCFFSLF